MSVLPDPISQSDFYADVPTKRLMAWLFDWVLILCIALFTTLIVGILTLGIGLFFFFGLWALIAFLYPWVSLSGRSATPGMRLMGIELRNNLGLPLDGITALLHTVGTMICFSTGAQIISIVMMLFTARKQGLVDMILGTAMMNKIARY